MMMATFEHRREFAGAQALYPQHPPVLGKTVRGLDLDSRTSCALVAVIVTAIRRQHQL
jgi:hypothetical protein